MDVATLLAKSNPNFGSLLTRNNTRIYSITEIDSRVRFRNSFCKIWSQNQDPDLSLTGHALTRRDASIGTHFGFFPHRIWRKMGFGISGFGPPVLAPICLKWSGNIISADVISPNGPGPMARAHWPGPWAHIHAILSPDRQACTRGQACIRRQACSRRQACT